MFYVEKKNKEAKLICWKWNFRRGRKMIREGKDGGGKEEFDKEYCWYAIHEIY